MSLKRQKKELRDPGWRRLKEESRKKAEWLMKRANAVQARHIRRLITDNAADPIGEIHSHSEKEAVYTMVKGSKSSDEVILIETSRDRIIRSTCESLARHMIERIQSTFPTYDGIGMNSSIQVDATKFLDDLEGDVLEDVMAVITVSLRNHA
ncbi:hypothetical protein HPP92_028205 [Vanilla planifolia]|uniref:Uncharacterized protein n=1 Tax=Vanilla planifolia TaxID=51239 RepID=A0A835P8C6_VANPL|nr:hypothetical protein HPP92_028205 [Vanilla planifolia]